MIFSTFNNIDSIPKTAIEKFWSLVIKGASEKDCWSFNYKISNNKRKSFAFHCDGSTYRAHIISFLIKNKTIPVNYYIIANCSNVSCINPEHLMLVERSSITGSADNKSKPVFWSPR